MKFIVKMTFLFLVLLMPVTTAFADTPPVPNPRRVPPPPDVAIDQWVWLIFAIGTIFAFISYRQKIQTK